MFWPHVKQSVGLEDGEHWGWVEDTLDRWHHRVQTESGQALVQPLRTINQSLSAQLSLLLEDTDRLVTRTQLKRTAYSVLGERPDVAKKPANTRVVGRRVEEYDEGAFDDSDFYHQMLREIISANSEVGLVSSALTARNSSKRKAASAVERRASKGRKIRYTVMPKLLNFMAPRPREECVIADELFTSLFSSAGRS